MMTLHELSGKFCASNDEWSEVLVFNSEDDIEEFVENGNVLGIIFTMKGEYGINCIKDKLLDVPVDYFYCTSKNVMAVLCLGLFDEWDGNL